MLPIFPFLLLFRVLFCFFLNSWSLRLSVVSPFAFVFIAEHPVGMVLSTHSQWKCLLQCFVVFFKRIVFTTVCCIYHILYMLTPCFFTLSYTAVAAAGYCRRHCTGDKLTQTHAHTHTTHTHDTDGQSNRMRMCLYVCARIGLVVCW